MKTADTNSKTFTLENIEHFAKCLYVGMISTMVALVILSVVLTSIQTDIKSYFVSLGSLARGSTLINNEFLYLTIEHGVIPLSLFVMIIAYIACHLIIKKDRS
jgi:hypothetical protein